MGPKFIKLTLASNNEVVYLNTSCIRWFYKNHEDTYTLITFADDKFLHVVQTPEEILSRINS